MEADASVMRPARALARVEMRSRTVGLILLGFALVASAALLTWVLHNAPFVMDEWSLMVRAKAGSPSHILAPWNGHLLGVGQLLAYLSILLAGSSSSLLVALDIGGVLACSALVYVFARRRIGPMLALAPAMVPLFFSGTSAFYGTGIQFTPLMGVNGVYSIDFGLAALLFLEGSRRRDDIAACAMLCLSLASFSYGLSFVVGAGLAVALTAQRWRRAYVVVVPLVLYGLWRVWASHQGGAEVGAITPEHVLLLPLYLSDSLSATGAGLFGLSQVVGRGPTIELTRNLGFDALSFPLFLVAVQVTLIFCVARALGKRGLTRSSLWPALATLVAMWSSQALVMDPVGRMPGDPRYLFAGAVMVAVVASELARGVRLSRLSVALVLFVAALGTIANVPRFREGKIANDQVLVASQVAGAMINLAGDNADPEFVPAASLPEVAGTMWISARNFQWFAREVEPLASMPIADVRSQSPELRTAADRFLAGALALRLTPGSLPAKATCARVDPGDQIRIAPGAVALRSPQTAPVKLRRFGDTAAVSLGEVPASGYSRLAIPPDRLQNVPWILSNDGAAALAVCRPA